MRITLKAYIALISAAAVLAAATLAFTQPAVTEASMLAVGLMCALALVAELLSVLHSKSVSGSVAFIPYSAAIIVAPNWFSLFGVTFLRLLFERKREPLKAWFNISQQSLTFALTALLYRATGGVALISQGHSLLEVSASIGFQAIISIIFSFALNSILVSGVLSITTGRPFRGIWRETYMSTIGLDLIAAPLVF